MEVFKAKLLKPLLLAVSVMLFAVIKINKAKKNKKNLKNPKKSVDNQISL